MYSWKGSKYLYFLWDLWSYTQGAVKLTKNAGFDKYKYSRYGIGFVACGSFSLPDGSGFVKNLIIFGADMSSSAHVNNRKNISWFLAKIQHQD